MSETESSSTSWRIPLLLTAGAVVAVIIALLMAQVDTSQRRSLLPPKSLPVVDTEATVVAEDLPRVYLPSAFGATSHPFHNSFIRNNNIRPIMGHVQRRRKTRVHHWTGRLDALYHTGQRIARHTVQSLWHKRA